MHFLLADTFTSALNRLTAQEQKAVKTTAFDLQIDPSAQGLSFHRLDRAKDPHFWSVRASADLRIIVHKTASSLLLCYVDHHDAAYSWAERRRIEVHPTTGAAQLVEVREKVLEYASTRERDLIWGVEPDLDEVYTTERHLLYVACTRARDHLLVAGVQPVSEFLGGLRGASRWLNEGASRDGCFIFAGDC